MKSNRNVCSIFTLAIALTAFNTLGQVRDTLTNLPDTAAHLTAYVYNAPSLSGFYTGHNSLYREEFAEKYILSGNASLIGTISHHTGVNTNNNTAEFNVYSVASSRLPGALLASKKVPYRDLDLSGKAMTTWFDTPVMVADSFFVSFNLNDYAHGGYAGDQIALLTGFDGTRSAQDRQKYGRNAIRLHNHDTRLWRDFYSQNFTPIATHFAIYPIVEFQNVTGIEDRSISDGALTLYEMSPNPVSDQCAIRFALASPADVGITIYDLTGRVVYTRHCGSLTRGEHIQRINLAGYPHGMYVCAITMNQRRLATRLVKN